MDPIFVNLSNHNSDTWGAEQKNAAMKLGRIVDIPFPAVNANGSEKDIHELAIQIVEQVLNLHPVGVMCQGEFTLTYQIVTLLKQQGIPVYAACTERIVREKVESTGTIVKESEFRFVQFRKYWV